MQCNICRQNSINIEEDHLKCEICSLSLTDVYTESGDYIKLFELVTYNFDLLEAFEKGKKDFILEKKENPYPFDDVSIRKKWEEGYESSEREMEREGYISSAKKLNEEIEIIEKEKKDLIALNKQYSEWNSVIFGVFKKLKKKYLWGFSYRKRIKKVYKIMERVGSKILNSE
jgi:hypothetical protein